MRKGPRAALHVVVVDPAPAWSARIEAADPVVAEFEAPESPSEQASSSKATGYSTPSATAHDDARQPPRIRPADQMTTGGLRQDQPAGRWRPAGANSHRARPGRHDLEVPGAAAAGEDGDVADVLDVVFLEVTLLCHQTRRRRRVVRPISRTPRSRGRSRPARSGPELSSGSTLDPLSVDEYRRQPDAVEESLTAGDCRRPRHRRSARRRPGDVAAGRP